MVLFPELIQYSCSFSKSIERPVWGDNYTSNSYTDPLSLCLPPVDFSLILQSGSWRTEGKRMLTYWSLLISEKCGAVATIHVGHADVVPISPVKFPEEGYG